VNSRKYFLIGMVILLMMPVISCSKTSLSLEEELDALGKCCANATKVQSYRMDYSITGHGGVGITEATATVEFVAPDRWHYVVVSFEGDLYLEDVGPDRFLKEFIAIGDMSYSRRGEDDQWRKDPESWEGSRSKLVSPNADGIIDMRDPPTELEKLPDEKVDRMNCLHLREWVEAGRGTQGAELWITRGDCLIRQLRFEGHTPAKVSPIGEILREEEGYSVTFHYYDFNKPIKIEPPEM